MAGSPQSFGVLEDAAPPLRPTLRVSNTSAKIKINVMSSSEASKRSNAETLRVCHVVNAFGETTGPANHAVSLKKHTEFDVGLLAWFKAAQFDDMDRIETYCLEATDTVLGVDRETVVEASSILSSFDIIHTHHPHSATYAKVLAHHLGASSVYTYGTNPSKYSVKGRLTNTFTNRYADRVTCVSPVIRDALHPVERWLANGERIEVIYTGVDIEMVEAADDSSWDVRKEAEVPTDAPLVGHAGRLFEAKGQDTLIRGIAHASDLIDETVHLVIAGDGHLRDKLQSIATEVGIDESVTFLGFIPRSQTFRLMTDVDVFAMPSRWEGFSSAAVEAMSLGTPCVFSDIPSLREPFDGVARFHPVDDATLLGRELADLLSDDGSRRRLGTKGRERVYERFTMETTARSYADMYRKILD